jgi:hypothetical protein
MRPAFPYAKSAAIHMVGIRGILVLTCQSASAWRWPALPYMGIVADPWVKSWVCYEVERQHSVERPVYLYSQRSYGV